MWADIHFTWTTILFAIGAACLAVDVYCGFRGVAFYFRRGIPLFRASVDIDRAITINALRERAQSDRLLSRRARLIAISNSLGAVQLQSRAVAVSPLPPMHAAVRSTRNGSGSRITIVGYLNFYLVPMVLFVLTYFLGAGELIVVPILLFFVLNAYSIQREWYETILDYIEGLYTERREGRLPADFR